MPHSQNEPFASAPLLSVVIAGHNDEHEVVPLINDVRHALQGHVEYEIIYVDDGSSDGSYHVLRQVGQSVSILRVIRLQNSVGPTGSLRAGIDAARGTWVVTLVGSGVYDPADIPSMFEMAMHYDGSAPLLVTGHRGGQWKSGLRQMLDAGSSLLRRLYLGEESGVDPACNFRLGSRELWRSLPWFNHMVRYMPALVTRSGGRVISVPINYRTRPGKGSSWGKVGLFAAMRDARGVRWLQVRVCRPEVNDGGRPGL
jgi:dolichol-phosphate mannosyltransferase